ncbi:MFS transporter (plasmid) [Rathayibacter sp. VKM Ac-2803]|nr:MFS transporter [Rathayibacter sp. VKM Ac-2803]
MSWLTITLIVVAAFGSGLALVVPMAFSMALRLTELAPGSEQVLGYILGVGALCSLVSAPLTGIVSDRTRSRWGRRRPFTVLGVAIGLAAVPVLAFAPNAIVLGIGWMLTSVGWGTAGGSIGNLLADRLPESQRGKVSGLTGLAGQVSPVLGILLAGQFTGDALLLFLVPATVGAVMVALFILFVPEADSRHLTFKNRLTFPRFAKSLLFRPRDHPAFAWALVGRFFFFFGLFLTVAYGTYFYAQRLGVPVAEVSSVMAVISASGVLSAALGSLGGGWVSDRFGTRRSWAAASTMIFATGCVVSAFSWTFPMLVTGALLTNLGIAAFGSVGQALILDVLPFRETEAGRFLAITSFSQRIPSAIGPLAAPLLLGLAPSDETQYLVLYLSAAALALLGGAVTLTLATERDRMDPKIT